MASVEAHHCASPRALRRQIQQCRARDDGRHLGAPKPNRRERGLAGGLCCHPCCACKRLFQLEVHAAPRTRLQICELVGTLTLCVGWPCATNGLQVGASQSSPGSHGFTNLCLGCPGLHPVLQCALTQRLLLRSRSLLGLGVLSWCPLFWPWERRTLSCRAPG
jgi:hypothetical protein